MSGVDQLCLLSDTNNNWWPLTIFNEFHLCHDVPGRSSHCLHASSPPSPVAAFMGARVIENQLEAARISDPQPRIPPLMDCWVHPFMRGMRLVFRLRAEVQFLELST